MPLTLSSPRPTTSPLTRAVVLGTLLSTVGMSTVGLALVAPPTATSAAAVASTSAGPRGYARLYEPNRTPIARVPFTLNGKITSDVKRPMKLERVFSSGKSKTIARAEATRGGTFTFRGVRIPKTVTLRAVAPRFRGSLENPKPRTVTADVVVDVVTQSGSSAAVPPVVQPGAAPAAPSRAGHVVAGFEPARPGRRVQLQRQVKGRWVVAERTRQDRGGFAAFPAPPGRTYRAVTLPAGRAPAVTTGTARSRAWSPSFEDTFDGAALDRAVWADRPAEGTETQGPRTCARVDGTGSTSSVGGGTLKLGIGLDPVRAGETCSYSTPRYGPGTSPYLLNSQIDTRDSYRFTHGYAAARIRWQQPKGMHGGFWLLPSTGKVPGRPELGTEVDVVEHFGQGSLRGGVGAFVHHLGADGANVPLAADYLPTAQLKPRGDQWWESYHVFSVEWTPDEYVFRVDGREFWREDRAVSQAEEYLVLSMLTSDYELRDLAPDELSATASVDWVQVWQS